MKLQPPYKPIDQLPSCAVPACLTMILERRELPYGTQEEIRTALGNEEHSFSTFFESEDLELKQVYMPANAMEDPSRFISRNMGENRDVMVCFNYQRLYGEGEGGHVSLIDEIEGNQVTLLDPEVNVPKYRTVSLQSLMDAMDVHGEHNGAGFWLIY